MGNCLALVIKEAEWFVFPFPGILHADPLRTPDPRPVVRISYEIQRAPGQVQSVCGMSDLERARELARAREIDLPVTQGLGSPDEHCLTAAGLARHNIEHLIHPVNQVNVGMPRGTEQNFRVLRAAFGGVGCEVMGTDIGFGLHDARPVFLPANATNEDRPDQVPGELFRITLVE